MDGRTSTDDDVIRDQQEKDLGHPERPRDSTPEEGGAKDSAFDKDRRPGATNTEAATQPSRNAGRTQEPI